MTPQTAKGRAGRVDRSDDIVYNIFLHRYPGDLCCYRANGTIDIWMNGVYNESNPSSARAPVLTCRFVIRIRCRDLLE